jgi:hypothetical protein
VQAYVWIWLPGALAPVVAGLLRRDARGGHAFVYGRSYLRRDDAISLFPDELPLRPGVQRHLDDDLPSCLRDAAPDAWGRRVIIQRLTGLRGNDAATVELDELTFLLESGPDELYGRMVFNVLCGNTDDHARNHAAFWDGQAFQLTPAYDICPQARTGHEASQAMLLTGQRRDSRLTTCLAAAPVFLLSQAQARERIDHQLAVIARDWDAVCDQAGLTGSERRALRQRQFLNPYCLHRWPPAP